MLNNRKKDRTTSKSIDGIKRQQARPKPILQDRWYLLASAVMVFLVLISSFVVARVLIESAQRDIAKDRYQAVHLESGQIFFGKIERIDDNYIRLKGAYYTSQPTPTEGTEAAGETENSTAPSLSLIRAGEEVYGPDGTVDIATSNVSYWENLRADSKLLEAISSKSDQSKE
mgnify:CR=1 FL=1|jgi:hypothetical protein